MNKTVFANNPLDRTANLRNNIEWIKSIKQDPKTKYLIRKLLEETEEDYQNLSNVIKKYGAKVHRPTLTEDDFSNRKLMKITDALGRTTRHKNNFSLFYIYDDGSVEKKIIVE